MRARDLGIRFDGTPGPLNGITDVAGVEVGMVTLVDGGSADAASSASSGSAGAAWACTGSEGVEPMPRPSSMAASDAP